MRIAAAKPRCSPTQTHARGLWRAIESLGWIAGNVFLHLSSDFALPFRPAAFIKSHETLTAPKQSWQQSETQIKQLVTTSVAAFEEPPPLGDVISAQRQSDAPVMGSTCVSDPVPVAPDVT